MSWRDELAGARYVPEVVYADMDDAFERAREAAGGAPLEYVGAGASAIVFKEGDIALKVGRQRHPVYYSMLEDEYEWLEAAHPVDPEHVVQPLAFRAELVVLMKEYVEGRAYGWADRNLQDWFWELGKEMEPLGWGMPEFKDDSFIRTETGFVLVDAGHASRLCGRLVDWVEDILDGRRHEWSAGSFDHEFLAFLVRREVQEGCVDPEVGEALERRLSGLTPNARQYVSWIVQEYLRDGRPSGRQWEPATWEAADQMRNNLTFQATRNQPEKRLSFGITRSRKKPVLELRDGIVQPIARTR